MARTAQAVDQEPIARLAEKVKALIRMLDRTRAELARTTDDNARLTKDVEAMQAQLATTQNEGAELKTLLAEREEIQTRVSEILDQLEAISL